MEADPRGNDLRKEQRNRRLGSDAACSICGVNDQVVLQRHEIPGRYVDRTMRSLFCANHHLLLHEALRDAGVDISRASNRTVPERIEAVLQALAAFFVVLAASLADWATRLQRLIEHMDVVAPDWRTWEVVQP
jgi:hypothetical protein